MATASLIPLRATDAKLRLYIFSPLPPQRNGLADYIVEYLPFLARDYEVLLVAESGLAGSVQRHFEVELGRAIPFSIISESMFAARQPDAGARILYNIGNNPDCAYMLDYLHRYPGIVMLHDVSLFYLHQVLLQRHRANGLMSSWLADEGFTIPDHFVNEEGSLVRTPGLIYEECLMVRRVIHSSGALILHSAYAQQRAIGAMQGSASLIDLMKKVHRIPHFVLPPAAPQPTETASVLSRFHIRSNDYLLLCPGFLTGNKMLYELLVAYRRLSEDLPDVKLVYAGEERPDEYPISEKILQLWPDGDGPTVTGYLSNVELDTLLTRADVSFVLRYPTYGETSGILPRAVMGGGRVITVDIGSYPEFESELVHHVGVGVDISAALERAVRDFWSERSTKQSKEQARVVESRRAASLSPAALYRRISAVIDGDTGLST